MPPEQLDQDAVNLAKAIRQTESGGNFTAKGKSGEYGAYQFTEPTWNSYSKKHGVNAPLNTASPQQQNEVAYRQIKEWKDQGYNPGQIASMWNSGKPDAYLDPEYTGTNKHGVRYDVPAYAKSVATAYHTIKGGGQVSVDPQNPSSIAAPQPEKEGVSLLPRVGEIGTELGSNLSGRLQDLSTAATTGSKGGLHIGSGLLQAGGAIAGGVGDVINAGLQLIPGVQALEKKIGEGVEGLVKTKTGQSLAEDFQKFAQENPETAKNIGAGVNIIAAIPLLRGIGTLKTAVTDAGTAAFKQRVTASAEKEIKDAVTGRAGDSLLRAERRGLNPTGVLLSEPAYLPKVIESPLGGFVYASEDAGKALGGAIAVDEAKLQNLLAVGVQKNIGVDLAEARKQMLKDITKDFPVSARGGQAIKGVNEFFDNVAPTTGGRSIIDIRELNGLKRDIGEGVNWDNLGVKSGEIKSAMYRSLAKQVEDYAEKAGVQGVHDLNRLMGEKLEAIKMLKALDGKRLKINSGSIAREMLTDVAGAAGEASGNVLGLPFAGTLASRGITRSLLRATPKSAVGKLSRYQPLGKTAKQGITKTAIGLSVQGLVPREKQ